jgi:Tol biopolymer transport system component
MSEYFQRIEAIYHESLRHEGEARSAFLRDACADNDVLRLDVERLLQQSESQHVFLDEQALGVAAQLVNDAEHTELIGRRLGPYQVHARIGAGGMGDVYRARDTTLGRDVAVKILPAALMSNTDRRARFEREARVLASLNHPNIGAIYGVEEADGVRAIVLELVEGETLAERLTRGPLPLKQALRIAREIADALEAAHEHGVVHRDLKPANVGLTRDGAVKVLDFGLAKLGTDQADQSADDLFDLPRGTLADTRTGMILGTPAYMSPEQARGDRIDKRTDIWAFGCVLFEMLAGHAAFQGRTSTEILTAILERDADLGALPVATPTNVQRLLARCLDKDTKQRLRDIGDARLELTDRAAPTTDGHTAGALPRRSWWAFGLLATAAAIATGLVFQRLQTLSRGTDESSVAAAPVRRFVEGLSDGMQLAPAPALAVSPDGRRIAYVVVQNGMRHLYVRELDQAAAHLLAGTEGADQPFFSPDGRWVGFFAEAKLKKVSVVGRAPVPLCDVASARGGSWASDDSIVFAPSANSVLLRVSSAGGIPEPITAFDRTLNEASHRWPHVLPGGDVMLFAAGPTVTARGWNEAHIIVQSLKTGVRRLLAPHGSYPLFAPGGHLLFLQDGILYAQRFDLERLDVAGEAVPILERVAGTGRGINGGAYEVALSATGTLAYLPDAAAVPDAMVWVDRHATEQSVTFPVPAASYFAGPRLSPDERHVAVTIVGATDSEVWAYDLTRGVANRLSVGGRNLWPVWAPDGTRIAYASSRQGSTNVHWKPADGSGTEEQLTFGTYTNFPHSWSPDGEMLALTEASPLGPSHILMLPLQPPRQPWRFAETPAAIRQPAFSPNGRWVAYVSNQSGRNEVYARAYAGGDTTIPISSTGGEEPLWARSGRELFFRRGAAVMAVDIVERHNTLSLGPPKQLFSGSYLAGGARTGYDVSADGQRFLMIKSSGAALNTTRFNIVVDWLPELEARAAPRR